LTIAPAAWNRSHSTNRMTAATMSIWITFSPPQTSRAVLNQRTVRRRSLRSPRLC
jgi:hypothetical protein